jgi:hypothetical protein
MSDVQPTLRPTPAQGRVSPSCAKCQIPMDMAPMVAGLGHLANRIFECSRCGDIKVLSEPVLHY